MSDPFVAEIRTVGFNFAPRGWALCSGQLLPISQNTALFSLLGTTYGGDGRSTFALPNLNGAMAIAPGQGPGLSQRDLGETSGSATVTLLESEIPAHTHGARAVAGAATTGDPAGATWANPRYGRVTRPAYAAAGSSPTTMSPQALTIAGGSQPHNNLPPYLGMYFVIALQGVYPPRG
ncbi:phage tail protein [Microbacterium fluvii]|uniref:Phage tail protein n=1 Tax=Microbacterium fluvii TaxID=415215 RepID=A0ABW2HED2_9MICO|nr:tail fiber protein [Microbacterium fluvii]MCU4672846.1 tail fiber protein [Microbacterium fluvii]